MTDGVVTAYRPHQTLAELEIRLGSRDAATGRFVAGVIRDAFDHLEEDLRTCSDLKDDGGYTELIDYHYATKSHGHVRTRVTFDAQCMEMGTEHCVKRAQDDVVLTFEDTAARISWATEHPLDGVPPGTCVPTHVRIKQRRRFLDVRDEHVVWSYELSKTWSAGSRTAAEHMQHVQEPVYEVECELVDEGGHYLASHTDQQIAASLSLKARLLMGETPP